MDTDGIGAAPLTGSGRGDMETGMSGKLMDGHRDAIGGAFRLVTGPAVCAGALVAVCVFSGILFRCLLTGHVVLSACGAAAGSAVGVFFFRLLSDARKDGGE